MLDIRLDDKVNIVGWDYLVLGATTKVITLQRVNKEWETGQPVMYKKIKRVDFEKQLLDGRLILMRWGDIVPVWQLNIVRGATIHGKYKGEMVTGTLERAGKQRIAISWHGGNLQWHSRQRFEYYLKDGVLTIDNRQVS